MLLLFKMFRCFILFVVLKVNKPPAKLNLLTCQVKRSADDKKSFDLFSRKHPPIKQNFLFLV